MSSKEQDSGEKVHDPTPHKLAEARKKGDLAKSTDVSAAAAYLGLLVAIFAIGAAGISGFADPLMALFRDADHLTGYILAPGGGAVATSLLIQSLAPVSALFYLPFLAALLSLIAQRVFVVAPEKLQPKLNRISPFTQAKNKFGIDGLVEFFKTSIKMSLVALVVLLVLYGERERMVSAIYLSPGEIGEEIARLILLLLASVCGIAAAIALPDYLWQRYSHTKKLRMSHEEMREEVKQNEGDPHLKSERRQRGQEIAANRMLLDMPKADVIIVNPTHYAVALKWNRAKGSAPVCVAKGVDAIAARIREAGEAAKVPIHADPPTARMVYEHVPLGAEILPQHYRAVAAAIRFADQMRKKAKGRMV